MTVSLSNRLYVADTLTRCIQFRTTPTANASIAAATAKVGGDKLLWQLLQLDQFFWHHHSRGRKETRDKMRIQRVLYAAVCHACQPRVAIYYPFPHHPLYYTHGAVIIVSMPNGRVFEFM